MKHSSSTWAVMLAAFVSTAALAAGSLEPAAEYAIVDRIHGPSIALWDYAAIDPVSRRLFLATGYSQNGGVTVLNLDSRQVIPKLLGDQMTHGLVILDDGTAVVAIGAQNAVRFFEEGTGRSLALVHPGPPRRSEGWRSPDALLFEPKTGFLIAVDSDNGLLNLVDVKRHVPLGSIEVGGNLEFAAARGDGTIYVNDETKNAIAVVDIPQRKLLRSIALRNCEGPTGLAYDSADDLLISVCNNGVAKFVDAASGSEYASISVGKGADAVMYDAKRKIAFIASGDDGTLSIIRVVGRHRIAVIQTIITQPGTRLGAVDPTTGRLYLPTAKPDEVAPPIRLPGLPPMPPALPGSFEFLVVGRL
jgi:hypothetical protein